MNSGVRRVRLATFWALESVGPNFSPALSWPQIWSLFWRRDSVGTNFAPDAVMFMSLLVLSFSFGTLLGAVFKPFPQYNQVLSFSFGKLCGAVFKPFPQYNEVLSLSFGMLLGAVFKPFPQYNQVLSFSFWALLGAAFKPFPQYNQVLSFSFLMLKVVIFSFGRLSPLPGGRPRLEIPLVFITHSIKK